MFLDDGKKVTEIPAGQKLVVPAQEQAQFRVLEGAEKSSALATNVVVVRQGGDLVMNFADGTVVVIENYFEVCAAGVCEVVLPKQGEVKGKALEEDAKGTGQKLAGDAEVLVIEGTPSEALEAVKGDAELTQVVRKILAPVEGIVKYLRINTQGGVMRPGDELVQISPTESELIVEVQVSPVDIGQLSLGLPVTVKLDAFDSSIYGSVEGELIYLSSDTLNEQGPGGQTLTYYRGHVRLLPDFAETNPKFAGIALRSGMTAGVDIRTGKRTILQFLGKPILRAFSGALTQR
jgi:hypothetical protein